MLWNFTILFNKQNGKQIPVAQSAQTFALPPHFLNHLPKSCCTVTWKTVKVAFLQISVLRHSPSQWRQLFSYSSTKPLIRILPVLKFVSMGVLVPKFWGEEGK